MTRSLPLAIVSTCVSAAAVAATPPLFTTRPSQSFDPPTNVASFGATLAAAGDVNGDGFADLLISAPHAQGLLGLVYLYLGGSGGYPLQPSWTSLSVTSDLPHGMGRLLAAGRDIDGDGFDDFVASATLRGSTEALYVFRGGPQGPAAEPLNRLAGLTLSSGITSLALCRDIDGDAFADLVVGVASFSGSITEQGRVNVYFGSPSGFSRSPGWFVTGAKSSAQLGTAVACGDVDGDGFDDVLASAPMSAGSFSDPLQNRGYAVMFRGSSRGLSATPSWQYQSSEREARFGQTLTIAGDLNGDKIVDIAIGSPRRRAPEPFNLTGRVEIFLGEARGLGDAPNVVLSGAEPDSGYGLAMASVGDVDRDGFDDLAIGSGQPNTSGVLGAGPGEEGLIVIHRGGAKGPTADRTVVVSGDSGPIGFGFSLAGPLDANGDGRGDLLVGARFATGRRGSGRAFLFQAIDLPSPDRPRVGSNFFADDAPPVFSFKSSTEGRYGLEFSRDTSFRFSRTLPRRVDLTGRQYQPTVAEWTSLLRYGKTHGELYWRVIGTSSAGQSLVGDAAVLRLRPTITPEFIPRVGIIEASRQTPPTLRWFANHNQRFRLLFTRTSNSRRGPALSVGSGYALRGELYEIPADTWATLLNDVVDEQGNLYVTIYALDALGRRAPTSQAHLVVAP